MTVLIIAFIIFGVLFDLSILGLCKYLETQLKDFRTALKSVLHFMEITQDRIGRLESDFYSKKEIQK